MADYLVSGLVIVKVRRSMSTRSDGGGGKPADSQKRLAAPGTPGVVGMFVETESCHSVLPDSS